MKRQYKSVVAIVLAFLLVCLAACGDPESTTSPNPSVSMDPVLIAGAINAADCEPERSIKSFQEIASFLGRRIDDWQKAYRKIEVTQADEIAIAEYIQLLIDEFDYEIVSAHNFDINAEDPFQAIATNDNWEVLLGLRTVDTGRETTGRIATDARGDIRLHCTSKGVLTVVFTDLFHTEDFGYRWSGSTGDRFNEVYGQRALDAYYLENGRYYNSSDRALSVEAGTHGEAVIIINGKEVLYSTDSFVGVETYVEYPCDDYRININDFMDGVDSEYIQITVPKTLMGGEVYTLSDALAWMGNSQISVYGKLEGNGWISSYGHPTARTTMNACTLRVLQWNEVECVVYLSMDLIYELEPMTIEILAAMPAYGSLWGETFKETEAITMKVGESLDLKYDGPYVFMPNYETYEWNISSGQGVSIAGSGDTCTVTAVSPGKIVIKCVYSYGKDEPDVLTGIPRNENHTKTKLYYILVTE